MRTRHGRRRTPAVPSHRLWCCRTCWAGGESSARGVSAGSGCDAGTRRVPAGLRRRSGGRRGRVRVRSRCSARCSATSSRCGCRRGRRRSRQPGAWSIRARISVSRVTSVANSTRTATPSVRRSARVWCGASGHGGGWSNTPQSARVTAPPGAARSAPGSISSTASWAKAARTTPSMGPLSVRAEARRRGPAPACGRRTLRRPPPPTGTPPRRTRRAPRPRRPPPRPTRTRPASPHAR